MKYSITTEPGFIPIKVTIDITSQEELTDWLNTLGPAIGDLARLLFPIYDKLRDINRERN